MAVVLFIMMLVTIVDVAGRYGFNAPLPGAVEITELLMGLLVFGGLPLVTLHEEHVTISLLDGLIRGRAKRVQRAIVSQISAVLVAFIAWRLVIRGRELASYGDRSSYLGVPLAPVAYFMSVMAALTAGALVLLAWNHWRGRPIDPSPDGQ